MESKGKIRDREKGDKKVHSFYDDCNQVRKPFNELI